MIELYTAATPNGQKAELMLEELGQPYAKHVVNLKELQQKRPEFLSMNPNGRIPVIVDRDGPDQSTVTVFESAAILSYLAERSGRFGGRGLVEKTKVLQWMMFQMSAVGPMFGNYSYGKNSLRPYNPGFVDRFEVEAKRIVRVLEAQLNQGTYFAGEDYTIADMCMFFWIFRFNQSVPSWFEEAPLIRRWLKNVGARPAVQKVLNAK